MVVKQIPIRLQPDSIRRNVGFDKFAKEFKSAKAGTVLVKKRQGRMEVKLIKTSASGFTISAQAASKDTSVTVFEKHSKLIERVPEAKKPQLMGIHKLWIGVKNYVLVTILLVLLALFLFRRR